MQLMKCLVFSEAELGSQGAENNDVPYQAMDERRLEDEIFLEQTFPLTAAVLLTTQIINYIITIYYLL